MGPEEEDSPTLQTQMSYEQRLLRMALPARARLICSPMMVKRGLKCIVLYLEVFMGITRSFGSVFEDFDIGVEREKL